MKYPYGFMGTHGVAKTCICKVQVLDLYLYGCMFCRYRSGLDLTNPYHTCEPPQLPLHQIHIGQLMYTIQMGSQAHRPSATQSPHWFHYNTPRKMHGSSTTYKAAFTLPIFSNRNLCNSSAATDECVSIVRKCNITVRSFTPLTNVFQALLNQLNSMHYT